MRSGAALGCSAVEESPWFSTSEPEVIEFFRSRGFRLAGLEEGHDDIRTGEMHADGIFVRDD
jgi:hypothetical protein